jgi:methylphosphotriester-DNA--protein-cysteine methyltransferase
MRGISAEYNITPTKLHNQFKEKHNLIPDDWVKQQKEEVDTSNWKDDYKPLEIETEDISI